MSKFKIIHIAIDGISIPCNGDNESQELITRLAREYNVTPEHIYITKKEIRDAQTAQTKPSTQQT